MKKRKFSVFTAIVTLFMQLVFIIQPTIALADETGTDITGTTKFQITNVEIKKDINGTELGEDIKKDSEIFIKYYWIIPNTEDVDKGDYCTIQLPREIKIVSPINEEINSTDGKVADMHIDTNGLVKLTFTDFANNYSNVTGDFYVNCHFKADEIGNNNPVPIEFIIPGKSEPVTVNIDFEQPDPSIQKSVDYNKANDEITWRIVVNKENVNVDNASIEDTIEAGQKFIANSVTINGEAANSSSYNYDEASRKFTYNLGNITKQQIITFKTSIHDDLATKDQGSYKYNNKATLNYKDDDNPKSITSNLASVTVPINLISKSGKDQGNVSKKIDWTITVNESGRTINSAAVKDTLPKGLKLVEGSVKINGSVVPANQYQYQFTDYQTESVLNINLGNITDKKVITFTTDVDINVYNSNNSVNYNNKAILSGEGVKEGTSSNSGVGVYPNIIQKNGAGYEASTGIITWKITVNSNETNVGAGAVVTDNIESNQTYVAGSATIDDGSNGSFITLSSGQVVYKFNNGFNKKYVITFKTQVIDPTHYRANHSERYKNTVNLTAPNINQNTTGYQDVNSEIIKKEGISYDYSTREITWKIVVNKNKMPITNAVVTDAIPEGQEYVAGSATIDNNAAGFFNSDSSINSTRILQYTFNGAINNSYTIIFKTKIIDLSIFNTSGDRIVKNTASITGNEIPKNGNNESTGTKTINNEIITKTSSYTNGNSYIDWIIETNPNWNIPMAGATITDILQEGLSLDTDTIELYKAIVNPKNGGLTTDGKKIELIETDKVMLTGENVKYDINTRKFDFTFPQDAGSGAFILKFRTNVSKSGNYVNKVLFKASGISDSDEETQNGVWFSSGGGSATGETGSIKILKTDGAKPLSGAVFQLIDQYGNVKAVSEPTKADGTVLFDKLKYERNYSIKEINAPTGYTLNSNVYTFQIKSDLNQGTVYDSTDGVFKFSSSENSKKIVNYNYKDEILRGSIQFHKAGVGEDVEGAVFALYQEDGNIPVKDSSGKDIIAVSKEDGAVIFNDIPYGKYKIKEISVPAPYSLYKGEIVADLTTITANGQVISTNPPTVYNSKIKGSIKIIKTDEETKEKIKGVTITLYDSKKEQIRSAKVTDENGEIQFDNLEYGDYYYRETASPDNYVLDDSYHAFKIEADSTASAPQLISFTNKKIKSDIEFIKIGEDADSDKLKGAVFGLYQNDGTTPVKYSNGKDITSTSGDDGKVQFKSIEYGTYKIKEITAPIGYKLSTEVLTAVIGKGDNGKTVNPTSGDKVENIKIRGNIEFTKKGDLADKNALKGAEFALYEEDGITPVTNLLGNIISTSDTDGKVRFNSVKYGKYKIKETKAPEGYNLSKEVLSVNITEDGVTVTPTFASGVAATSLINKLITGGIEISKTDFSTSAPVPGATIAIYTKDGTKVVEGVTGEDGKVKFEKLNYGEYYFQETNAPEGYLLNPDKHEFSIKEDGVVVKDSLTNTMITGGIEISKTDISTSAPVPGATLTIYTKAGTKVVEGITGEDGKIVFEKLNYGDYYFLETNAPEGYLLNTDKHEFSIKEDGTILKDTLTNTMITGGIEISKTDISTSEPVPGATITIYTKDGTKVVEGVTDKDGKVKFEKLNYGEYYFLETNAPEGYLLNTDKHEFSIKEDGVILKDNLTNTKKPSIDLPQTGGVLSRTSLIYVGVLFIVFGMTFVFKRRKKIN